MLLLFASGQGILIWAGPHPARTVLIEPEIRITRVT